MLYNQDDECLYGELKKKKKTATPGQIDFARLMDHNPFIISHT